MRTLKLTVWFLALLMTPALAAVSAENENEWENSLKKQYFGNRAIEESNDIIELDAPYRAEDPALVPLQIISKIPQTPTRYIKNIVVLVDKNPLPLVGEFALTPESGKADLAMRVRVNTYSPIRAIAELNDGRLFMSKKFVKASGGCSAPVGADLDAAMARLGKMKFRVDNGIIPAEPNKVQLLISHPNLTGMQMDQVTRFVKKSHFIKTVRVTYNNKPVLTAKTDIAISADPNFRFYFVPEGNGVLKAEVTDVSCESPIARDVCSQGETYSETYNLKP